MKGLRMRILLSLACFAFVVVGIDSASAADMPTGWAPRVAVYSQGGVRAPQVYVYDDQPGVYVRSYWREPWRGHHYYPFTGKKPKVGRLERLNAPRRPLKPAESYHREWSTSPDPVPMEPMPRAVLRDSGPRYVDPRYVDPRYGDASPYGELVK